MKAAVLHEYGATPRFGDFAEPSAGAGRRRRRDGRRRAAPPRPAQGDRHVLHGPAAAAVGGRDRRRRPAGRRAARLLRRDGGAVRLDGRAGAGLRGRAVRGRPTASTTCAPPRWATPGSARGSRSPGAPAGAGGDRARARGDRRRRDASPCRPRSCSARAGWSRRRDRASAWRGCAQRGADAIVELGGDDPTAALRDAAGGGVDVTIDTLWGEPALAAIQARRAGRGTSQVGQIAGLDVSLPAPAVRSVSLDLCGFSVAHPPVEVRREGYRRLAEHVARGDIDVDVERVPLEQVATAWERQREAIGGAEARARTDARKGATQMTATATIEAGRPVVFRRGTVLTMNDAHDVLRDADVLVVGDRIAAVGTGLEVPDGTFEIDASDGIVMPGMVDTHRHMWQTALRGYGADWTLSQYFVFFYLEWGKIFRPAGHPCRQHAVGARVARSRGDHDGRLVARAPDGRARGRRRRRAAVRPGAVRARLRQHPAGTVGVGDVARLPPLRGAALRERGRHAGLPDGVRRHRRSRVPRAGGVQGRARARGPGHHARRRLGCHERRRDPADARARVHDAGEHLRARGDARGGLLSPDRGDRRLGLRVDGERAERRPGLPAHVAAAPARHPGLALDGHQRVVERGPVLRHAVDARRGPLARAPRGACAPGHGDAPPPARGAGGRLGDPRRQPRAAASTR